MSDEDTETGPGPELWRKSQQIRRSLGLQLTSVYGAIQFYRGWKNGTFTVDNLQGAAEVAFWLGLVVYNPLHSGVIWFRKRVAAGKDPDSNASEIVPPVAVRATIDAVKRLTQ